MLRSVNSLTALWDNADADTYVTFSLTPNGSIGQARMDAVLPSTDFSFDFQEQVPTPVTPEDPEKQQARRKRTA